MTTLTNSADVARKLPPEAIATDASGETDLPGTIALADIPVFPATADGRAKLAASYFNEATVDAKFAAGAIDASDRVKAGSVITDRLAAGVVSADAAGRALMAAGVFDEATVDAKFAAGAIDASDRLKAASVITDRIAAGAVTGAKQGAGILAGVFTAGNGAGARTLVGAVAGQRVLAFGNITTPGALGTPADFEATITVNDQIQQLQTDHTAKVFFVLLLPAAA